MAPLSLRPRSLTRSLFQPLLITAAGLYGLGLWLDRWLRKSGRQRLPLPVISIGNLTVGGTGKTPLLLRLAVDLIAAGASPAVLTRGYRGAGKTGSPLAVVKGPSRASDASDEVRLMAERLPSIAIGVGADRALSAQAVLRESKPDLFLLDDGFQHWPLERDLDIVCVDATDPWGGSLLVPAGRLREPVEALGRAHVVVITRAESASAEERGSIIRAVQRLNPRAAIVAARFEPALRTWQGRPALWNSISGRRALAVSGIGNPDSFEKTLSAYCAGITPVRFADHHDYSRAEVERLIALARKDGAVLVTTDKDRVKWAALGLEDGALASVFILAVDVQFSGDDAEAWGAVTRRCLSLRK